jgi:hypothetical protein
LIRGLHAESRVGEQYAYREKREMIIMDYNM